MTNLETGNLPDASITLYINSHPVSEQAFEMIEQLAIIFDAVPSPSGRLFLNWVGLYYEGIKGVREFVDTRLEMTSVTDREMSRMSPPLTFDPKVSQRYEEVRQQYLARARLVLNEVRTNEQSHQQPETD